MRGIGFFLFCAEVTGAGRRWACCSRGKGVTLSWSIYAPPIHGLHKKKFRLRLRSPIRDHEGALQ